MSATATTQRYRVPQVSAEADVSLDEFYTGDVVAYLRHLGYTVTGGGVGGKPAAGSVTDTGADPMRDGLWIGPDDLLRIHTLALCGQTAQARQELADIISQAIDRPL